MDVLMSHPLLRSLSILAWALLVCSSVVAENGFQKLQRSKVPREAILQNCDDLESHPCWQEFQRNGKAYAVDVDDDGETELLIHIGFQDEGSGGDGYVLLQKKGATWKEIDDGCWLLYWGLRLRKLENIRFGYHDLRIGHSLFVKWDGTKYVPFDSADFRALPTSLFDAKDPQDAEILWLNRYAGSQNISFTPQWNARPKPLHSWPRPLKDPVQKIDWVSVYKGGVWGIQGKRVFLLLPRAGYLGATDMQLEGDWLILYGDPWCHGCTSHMELARYQLRSHEIVVARGFAIPFVDQ